MCEIVVQSSHLFIFSVTTPPHFRAPRSPNIATCTANTSLPHRPRDAVIGLHNASKRKGHREGVPSAPLVATWRGRALEQACRRLVIRRTSQSEAAALHPVDLAIRHVLRWNVLSRWRRRCHKGNHSVGWGMGSRWHVKNAS